MGNRRPSTVAGRAVHDRSGHRRPGQPYLGRADAALLRGHLGMDGRRALVRHRMATTPECPGCGGDRAPRGADGRADRWSPCGLRGRHAAGPRSRVRPLRAGGAHLRAGGGAGHGRHLRPDPARAGSTATRLDRIRRRCSAPRRSYFPSRWPSCPCTRSILAGFPDWRARVRDWLATCLFLVPIVALELLIELLVRRHADVAGQARRLLAGPGAHDGRQLRVHRRRRCRCRGSPGGARRCSPRSGAGGSPAWPWRCWRCGLVSITLGSFWLPRSFIPLSGVLAVAAGLAFATSRGGVSLTVLVVVAAGHAARCTSDVRQPGLAWRGLLVRSQTSWLRTVSPVTPFRDRLPAVHHGRSPRISSQPGRPSTTSATILVSSSRTGR